MSRFSAFVLALAFLLTQGLFAKAPADAQQLDGPNLLSLNVDSFEPRILTAGSEDRIRVSGTVTNTGDREVSDVVARLQIGQTLSTPDAFQEATTDPPPTDAGATEWIQLSDALSPGESAPVEFDVPAGNLPLGSPGVYPLLINVNGTPAYGGAARLASMNAFLPVTDPPSEAEPTRTSLLWPLTGARPRVLSDPHDDTMVLSDDDLATALAPGGRLDALVSSALAKQEDSAVFGSMCFAIDPELLDTVDAMAGGYRVQTDDGVVEGTGADNARRWLDRVRSLVASHCVVQMPYADADLGTLSQVDTEADLTGMALNGASILEKTGVQPRQGVVWTGGSLTDRALQSATSAGANTFLTPPVDTAAGPEDIGRLSDVDGARRLTYDPLVESALTGDKTGSSDRTAVDDPDIATQNGIAALAFRGGLGEQPAGPVVVAPPRRITATTGELTAFLDSYAQLSQARMVTPTALDDVLSAPVDGTTPVKAPGDTRASAAFDSDLIGSLGATENTTAKLEAAMSVDPARQVRPAQLLQPLHNAVIRATSTTWEDRPRAALSSAEEADRQLDELAGHVSVATLAQPVLRGSESAPLPVSVRNDLPVQIRVRLQLENIAGLRPAHIPVQTLSANSTISPQVPAETLRAGRFKLNVNLTTPDGTQLGRPAQLELSSTELSTVTLVITIVAGVALVLLAGRRIVRRVKRRGDDDGPGAEAT